MLFFFCYEQCCLHLDGAVVCSIATQEEGATPPRFLKRRFGSGRRAETRKFRITKYLRAEKKKRGQSARDRETETKYQKKKTRSDATQQLPIPLMAEAAAHANRHTESLYHHRESLKEVHTRRQQRRGQERGRRPSLRWWWCFVAVVFIGLVGWLLVGFWSMEWWWSGDGWVCRQSMRCDIRCDYDALIYWYILRTKRFVPIYPNVPHSMKSEKQNTAI